MSDFGPIHALEGNLLPLELNSDVLGIVRQIQAQNAAILEQNALILRWVSLTVATFISEVPAPPINPS